MIEVDPVTLEVIRSSLSANLDEIELTLCRTAHSSTVYEVRDMCAGWITPDGSIIAQGRYGLPIFMADLGVSVARGTSLWAAEGFRSGDMFVTNDPWSQGQHLNNVVVYSPILYRGRAVAFTATRAHWADVGGKSVGSWGTDSTEIFQEGVQWDNLRVARAGVEDAATLRMISANVRFPEQSIGDLRAQMTACRLGEARFLALVDKYGLEVIEAAIERIWDQSEQRARQVIAAIPDGTYRATSFLDNDGITLHRTLPVVVAVTIEGSDMTVDLTGTSPQVPGPMNCGVSGAAAAARVAFKCLTSPKTTADEGAFRPMHLIVPPRTFVSAEPPAALAQWSTMLPTLIETIITALAPVIPDRVVAAHMGDLAACFFLRPTSPGKPGFVHADPFPGGWGARPNGDGPVPLKSYAHGDTYKISSELEELRYPFRVLRYEFRTDSAGPGRFRGSPGISREFEILEDLFVTVSLERSKCPPWGLFGGGPGAPPVAELTYSDGRIEQFNKATMKPVPAGSRLAIRTAGGGGYGPPEERDPERVRTDVRRGLVSPEQARDVYGVVIAAEE